MSIERRWVCVCDGCQATAPELYAPTKRDAAKMATGAGWRRHGGKLLCEDCRATRRAR